MFARGGRRCAQRNGSVCLHPLHGPPALFVPARGVGHPRQGRQGQQPSHQLIQHGRQHVQGCGKEELTVKVLNIMCDTLDINGNIITFNIVLK